MPLRWAGALVMLGSHRVLPLAALTLLREGLATVEILELRSDMEDCILRSINCWNELGAGCEGADLRDVVRVWRWRATNRTADLAIRHAKWKRHLLLSLIQNPP